MFFENSNGMSPVSTQDFAWVGVYADGSHICEFDANTKRKNDFYKINKQALMQFGLIGHGMKLYFDVSTGIFFLNGQRFGMTYKVDGKEYALTGHNTIYNDIVTYKDAYTDADIVNPNQKFISHIHQFNFGYKNKLIYKDGQQFHFQVICSIPYNEPAYLAIKLVSNKDLDGELIIKKYGRGEEVISAPLRRGYSGNTNWVIK